MNKPFCVLATCSLVVMLCSESKAVLIASDSFATSEGGNDYVPYSRIWGQSPTVGAPGFVGAWDALYDNTNSFVPIDERGLTHPLTPGDTLEGLVIGYTNDTGFANRRVSREIEYTPSDGTYYMSVLLQKNQATGIDLLAGLVPLESYNWSFSNIRGTYVGVAGGSISFLTANRLIELVPQSQVSVGETYFALMQYDYSTSGPDQITATVYDGSSAEIANRTFAGLNLDGDIGRFGLLTSDFSPNVVVDEWRFGTMLRDVMVPTLSADFDKDGDVDGEDFLIWQTGFPTLDGTATSNTGDANGDGNVNGDDFLLWQNEFGSGLAGGGQGAIPEPATVSLAMLAVAVPTLWRRRR